MPRKVQLRQVDTRTLAIVLVVAAAVSTLLLLVREYASNNRAGVITTGDSPGTTAEMEEPFNSQTVFIKGGCFQAGSPDGEADDGEPAHEVCVDDYYMLRHEVTAGEFEEFIRSTGYRTDAEKGNGCYRGTDGLTVPDTSLSWENPGFPQSERHPAVCVSWNDAVQYVAWKSGVDGQNYRLPTAAEWEFAARSRGLLNRWAGTNLESELDYYAWYEETAERTSHPVGKKRANGIGLYDMSGNVREWVSADYSLERPNQDLYRHESGEYRLARGGSWASDRQGVRIENSSHLFPSESSADLGFRFVHPPG